MKTYFKVITFLLISFFLINCTKKDETPADLEINDFIWKGLNAYYYWQGEIPNLSDTRFSSSRELNAYLGVERDPAVFFESLLYQRNSIDKWSWIVDDYIALEKSLQGISKHNGMEFGLVAVPSSSTALFGYVRYVLPNTDAQNKNVQRGMLFNAINSTPITRSNYRSLLFSSDSYTVNFADYNGGTPISNGNTVTLTKSEYQENPIFIAKTITVGTNKIGYLMYNSFSSDFDSQLNAAMATLKADGITDLILDLRYNGGGSVRTARYLSSMITGQFTGQLFSKNYWNAKAQSSFPPESLIDNFTDNINTEKVQESINSLGFSKVYIIATGSTASASELVINSLKPYIDVQLVGTKTLGKYVASVTLYDSPNFLRAGASQNHTWALQPIIIEIKNKLDTNDKDGFDPNILLSEMYDNLGVLGDLSDPLLQRTITYITTGAKGRGFLNNILFDEVSNSKLALPTRNNMFVNLKN